MPHFLTQQEVYRLLQRELPPDVYADGEQQTYYTTADMGSVAAVAASGYTNLSQIYDNYFPGYADLESMPSWEIAYFGYVLDATLSLAERRDRVLAKLRARKGFRTQDIYDAVLGVVGTDKLVEIVAWSSVDGSWIIGFNQLGITTILGSGPRLAVALTGDGTCACTLDPEAFGITPEQLAGIQQDAYAYSVLIYGYTLSAAELQALDAVLNAAEPARSQHYIASGLDPADMIHPLPNIDGGQAFSTGYIDFLDGGTAGGTGMAVVDGGGAI